MKATRTACHPYRVPKGFVYEPKAALAQELYGGKR